MRTPFESLVGPCHVTSSHIRCKYLHAKQFGECLEARVYEVVGQSCYSDEDYSRCCVQLYSRCCVQLSSRSAAESLSMCIYGDGVLLPMC